MKPILTFDILVKYQGLCENFCISHMIMNIRIPLFLLEGFDMLHSEFSRSSEIQTMTSYLSGRSCIHIESGAIIIWSNKT